MNYFIYDLFNQIFECNPKPERMQGDRDKRSNHMTLTLGIFSLYGGKSTSLENDMLGVPQEHKEGTEIKAGRGEAAGKDLRLRT